MTSKIPAGHTAAATPVPLDPMVLPRALIKRSGLKRSRFQIKHPANSEENEKHEAKQGEFVPDHGFVLGSHLQKGIQRLVSLRSRSRAPPQRCAGRGFRHLLRGSSDVAPVSTEQHPERPSRHTGQNGAFDRARLLGFPAQ